MCIIGAGALGSTVARALARKGLSATIVNKSGSSSLATLVKELRPTITADTIKQAASADIVIVTVPWAPSRRLASRKGSIVSTKKDGTDDIFELGLRLNCLKPFGRHLSLRTLHRS